MFDRVLIANRGAIACRIVRTLRRMGVGSVAVYSDADRNSLHVSQADVAVPLGGLTAAESYLRQERLIEAALLTGAGAVHPGYGFLSENASFAQACADAGLAFIGPTPDQIRDFGLKHRARALAAEHGLPLLPGSGLLRDSAEARSAAERIGYPVMLKSTAGGGGIGMRLCRNAAALEQAYVGVARIAASNFSDGGLFLEKYIERARHIEVQLFGDGAGHVVALGERDCSMQRRNQKVIEETPAPGLDDALRARLHEAAVALGRAVRYRSAGTVEFVYDVDAAAFYFLEVNTRLQVEHGVTEEVTGIDLIEWMIRVAAGETPPALASYRHAPRGHSVQVRLYAEDPARGFRPSSGTLTQVAFADGVRVDSWIESGTQVTPYYDPMLAKMISHAPTRAEAIAVLDAALARTSIHGIETNLTYLRGVLQTDAFRDGQPFTRFLAAYDFPALSVEVLKPGTHSTVQEYPGRLGYWNVGVPPSGPMDMLAFRLANRVVSNEAGVAALELTGSGPTLKFGVDAVIALAGAAMRAQLDGVPVSFWQPIPVRSGSVLAIDAIAAASVPAAPAPTGQRTYLAVRGGFDVPEILGSRATFTLGQFGGHAGRALRAGDVLRLKQGGRDVAGCTAVPAAMIPRYAAEWHIAVIYGPHGAPDFFTEDDVAAFFAADWKVHYNSSRTGVRLIGPKPRWARDDGGEAGLHPSNIHDNAYAVGAIDYTGDMPVILGPDGPSLGGFVCPAVVAHVDLWKLGQLRPGDTVRFECIDDEQATALRCAQDEGIGALAATAPVYRRVVPHLTSPVLHRSGEGNAAIAYRRSGEDYLLVEFGPPVLDLELRLRAHALMQWLEESHIPGIVDLTPGIRSLQIHYDRRQLSQSALLDLLRDANKRVPSPDELEVPSRIVHLPLSWDDPATRLAIERYTQSVRADAPWCPSNIEFIRRINGLDSIDDVQRIVFEASYLVMGLGDVYLGAPVATPLDPRHRLVTTKYNPARTWTPENAVGIGGAYLCVYGMEGPGGYQFVGRTVQMWNRYRGEKQWLLRCFDQIRFHPVTADELLRLREDFPHGRCELKIEHTTLSLREQRGFVERHVSSIAGFKSRQQAAFEAERSRWKESAPALEAGEPAAAAVDSREVPEGCEAVHSPVTGSVWKTLVTPGQPVRPGDELLVLEAMKMEVPLLADQAAEVVELRCAAGRTVTAGEPLVILRPR
jgi:urea carboxylase